MKKEIKFKDLFRKIYNITKKIDSAWWLKSNVKSIGGCITPF